MSFRDSFSQLKKKVKHRLTGKKSKPNETGTDFDDDSTGPLSGTDPHVVAGGSHDQEGEGANADGGQVISMVRPQPNEPGSASGRGGGNDQGRKGIDVDVREVNETHLHLHSIDVGVAEGSGPTEGKDIGGEKVERGYPSPSTTSIPHDGKPDST